LEQFDVHRTISQALMIVGLVVGASTLASASPATNMAGRDAVAQTSQAEQVDYVYNHHHYSHRSWDKAHHRWRYH
jgi:hypothetical protein